jgi:RNA polymerase sigma factor (TIGR02999 family)
MSIDAPTACITQWLNGWAQGDDQALDRLAPRVYAQLRQMAGRLMRSERPDHVLQGTALVHEAFMRMGQQRQQRWASRAQFFGWMSMTMRRILVEHARQRSAACRGGGLEIASLDLLDADAMPADPAADLDRSLLDLDQALRRLEVLDERQARVVELRFFGGLGVEETAEALQCSPATVKREWATARAWLLRELQPGSDAR